ncbi:hypothetical protein C2E23DRAFT_816751 [Lenzites betulinus]|nr:hypothetical protein C2E23DRAFT_834316 [Lenzites betulinus]KAH9855090.1 hypothetical protein C2E23DRAFT_816751 [Lenzites betulinus]
MPRLITLGSAPHVLLCPLPVITSVHSDLVLQFSHSYHEGSESRYILCAQRAPLLPGPRPIMPVLLELTGQICINDCYLTSRGHIDPNDPDAKPVAMCWIEARPDIVSRVYWRSVLPTLQTFMEHIPGPVDVSKLVAVAPDGSVRLQVMWLPDEEEEEEELEESLPVFDQFNNQRVPMSISEVPFGVAVRVVFSVEYHYDSNNLGPATMYASLTRIALV